MDWYNNRTKRSSISTGAPSYSPTSYGILSTSSNISSNISQGISGLHSPFSNNQQSRFVGSTPIPKTPPLSSTSSPSLMTTTTPLERNSYYFSQLPLYASDWRYVPNSEIDCIALGSYKEGFTNKLEIIHGVNYEQEFKNDDIMSPTAGGYDDEIVQGFYFSRVAETSVDYPITHLQWDPMMGGSSGSERLAASSEVLRLYKVSKEEGYDHHNTYNLTQTHILANNTASSCTSSSNSVVNNESKLDDINTYPPITSFDWNKTDPSILITSSVDTTCTVWDLHRSHPRDETTDTATVKTQLIAHDSEVFDVKCIHKSTNVFASVGNDGSMRVFDLRSLEHSTIIYEPPSMTTTSSSSSTGNPSSSTFNSKALICLSTSNIDQHHLATVGINSNMVIIIDMRMPGIPVATIDGSFGGINHASINSVQWHPTSNYLLTGGDDCQALVWDCNNLTPKSSGNGNSSSSSNNGIVLDTPVLAYEEDLEVNNICWRKDKGDWMGVISGKGFQAVSI